MGSETMSHRLLGLTAADLDDFHDADGREIQSRYAAYMLAHGYDRVPPGNQYRFIAWSEAMWQQSGISRNPTTDAGRAAMAEWLPARLAGPVLPLEAP